MLSVCACLLGLALLPPVQLGVIRLFTRDLAAFELDIGRFGAGPWGLGVEDLQLRADGLSISIAAADIDIAFWSSLSGLRLDIESATISGVEVRHDYRPAAETAIDPAGTPEAAAAPATADLSPQPALPDRLARLGDYAAWPDWLLVREAELSGQVLARTATDLDIGSRFELRLADWRVDGRATAELRGAADAGRAGETLAAVGFDTRLAADIAPAGPIDAVDATIALSNSGDARGIDATLAAGFAAARQQVSLTVDARTGARLATIEAVLDAGSLVADWDLDLPAGIVAAFARGRSTADLRAHSSGQLTLAADGAATIRASGEASGSGWETIDPRLVELGTLTLAVDADAAVLADRITARAAGIHLDSASQGELLTIDVLQPLSFDTDSWLIDPEKRGEPALRVCLDAMPLRWLRPFDPSGLLVDGEIGFAFELIRDEARQTRLVVAEPLHATGVALAPVGGVDVPLFDIRLSPQATLADGEFRADITELAIAAENGLTVAFTGTGRSGQSSWPAADFDGEITASVPALTRLVPVLDQVRANATMRFDFETLMLAISGAAAGAYTVDGREILLANLSGQEPLQIALPFFLPDWDAFQAQSATLAIDRLPVDWLSPWLPEFEIRGGEVSGRLRATTGAGSGLSLVAEAPLTVRNLAPGYRGRPLAQTLTASINPSLSLSSAASRFRLDDIEITAANGDRLSGRLSLEAEADDDRVAVELDLDGRFPTLVAFTGARLGTLHIRQRGSLSRATQQLGVEQLEIELTDADDSTLLRIGNLQPFAIDPSPLAVSTAGDEADILRLAISPLELGQLLPNVFGFDLDGVLPEGEFRGRVEPDGGVSLRAETPLDFRDVTVRWQDAVLLDRVTMSAQCEFVYSAAGFEARSIDLVATTPDGERMLTSSAQVVAPLTAESTWTRAAFRASASLPALASQPVLAGLPVFSSGRFDIDVAAVNSDRRSFTLDLGLLGAATAATGSLPTLELGVEAEGVPGGSASLSIPLRLSSETNGDSDLRFDGVLERHDDGPDSFRASLTGARLVYSDIAGLIGLLADDAAESPGDDAGRSSAESSALAILRTERHRTPFWPAGVEGTAAIDIASIALPSVEITAVGGQFELAPESAQLVDLHASALDSGLTAHADLSFDAAMEAPYALDFAAAVDGIEIGQLFRLVEPEADAEPTTEGRFDIAASLTGRGRNPIDLGLAALGEIRLSGRDGIFRGLAGIAGTGSTASRVIGVLTFSRELRALARLLEGLGEIPFERFDIALTRASSERLELETFVLRAAQVEFDAVGSLMLAPGRPVLLSPLELSTRIAARGDVAVLFDGMDLLEPAADGRDDDYRALIRPVVIGGTPSEPDATAFWELLGEGADNARGVFGAGLRALDRRLDPGRADSP